MVSLAVIFPVLAGPLAAIGAILVWLRLRRRPDEAHIIAELDRLLQRDSDELRRARPDPLRVRTAEQVPVRGLAWGLGLRSGRVQVVRMIRAATPSGYRLRLRAFARVVGGRTLVRSIDVELPRS